LVLAACSSGSALVTGHTRPAIDDYTTVRILTEIPDGAIEIAIVNASSDTGRYEEQDFNYALVKLRKKAAKVGANAVVITDRRTTSRTSANGAGPGGQGHIITSTEVVKVRGVAIWVEPSKDVRISNTGRTFC
jgi:hypothetical protein